MNDNAPETDTTSSEALRALVDGARSSSEAAAVDAVPMLTFRVSSRALAVDVAAVREVVALESITKVPGVRGHVAGVALVRGRLVPVADIAGFFPRTTSDAALVRPRLIVLQVGEREAGVQVDETYGVYDVPRAALARDGITVGEVRWNDRLIAIMDATAVIGLVDAGAD